MDNGFDFDIQEFVRDNPLNIKAAWYAVLENGVAGLVILVKKKYPDFTDDEYASILAYTLGKMSFACDLDNMRVSRIVHKELVAD